MYAQLVDTGLKKVVDASEMSPEEQAFQARVDADVKVEPKDWMPDAYRRTLVRQIQQHAFGAVSFARLGEIVAAREQQAFNAHAQGPSRGIAQAIGHKHRHQAQHLQPFGPALIERITPLLPVRQYIHPLRNGDTHQGLITVNERT